MWAALYPADSQPYVYFLNPEGLGYYDDLVSFEKIFRNSYLFHHKDEPVLVFDTCIHNGSVMYKATQFLHKC